MTSPTARRRRLLTTLKQLLLGSAGLLALTALAAPADLSPTATRPGRPIPSEQPRYGVHSIAFIGCSNTWMTVEGYHNTPGNRDRLWEPYGTGGKTIRRWADPDDPIWKGFDRLIEKTYGQPAAVWVQLCEDERQPSDFDDVRQVIANLSADVTTRTFYISPLNSYSPKLLCQRMGNDGIDDLIQLANLASATGLARRGPDVGPLSGATTETDRCHPDAQGRLAVGGQLQAFIDAL